MKLNHTLLAFCCKILTALGILLQGIGHAAEPPSVSFRSSICLNGGWEVATGDDRLEMPSNGWSHTRVPALPFTEGHTKALWYRLILNVPHAWAAPGRRYYLEVEKAGHYAAVFCNGHKAAEHYGQYTPFEADLTASFRPGEKNELAIYVHDASGRFVRPGADITDAEICNAYRPATDEAAQRNWIGIVGDLALSYRPATRIADVFVDTSIRKKSLTAHVAVQSAGSTSGKLTCAATVLDGEKVVLSLEPKPVTTDSEGTLLGAPWSDPVLWGSAPYGEPKLYTLRAELLADGKVVDRTFTRFGFREIWVEGRNVVLNGKKLWLAGTYHRKLSPLRYLNDRRPMRAALHEMQASGLNAFHGHWDDLGRNWLETCDENGMFVLGAFFCDGRPKIQSRADAGWVSWMTDTCAEWVLARRGHPSILLWRPADVLPPRLDQFLPRDEYLATLGDVVRRHDPAKRPLADMSPSTDVVAWGQPPENPKSGKLDNLAPLEENARNTTKPILCKEIYGGFKDVPGTIQFFRTYYEKSFELKSTGIIVQNLPLLNWRERMPYAVEWPSASGSGNRAKPEQWLAPETPNWCDPGKPAWKQSAFAEAFGKYFKEHMKTELMPSAAGSRPELLVAGLAPDSVAWLAPADTRLANPLGALAGADGSAWFVVPHPGQWRLVHEHGEKSFEVRAWKEMSAPGYASIQRVNVAE